MPTIAIASLKGGTGKTATTAALGAGLTRRGYKILLVDLDPQGNLSAQLGAATDDPIPTISELLTRKARTQAAIQSTAQGDIIPSTAFLASKKILTGVGAEYRLKQALEPVKRNYDAILIDCPPNLGLLTYAALTAADYILIPAKADRFSIDSMREIYDTIQEVQNLSNKALQPLGIVITQYNGRATVTKQMRDEMAERAEKIGLTVYDPPIRRCIAVEEAEITGSIYDSKNNAREDYDRLLDQILATIDLKG